MSGSVCVTVSSSLSDGFSSALHGAQHFAERKIDCLTLGHRTPSFKLDLCLPFAKFRVQAVKHWLDCAIKRTRHR